MRFYICVSVIMVSMLLFHVHTEAYQAQKLVPANPNHPGKCYDEDTNVAYAVGDTLSAPEKCERYSCQTGQDNQFILTTTGCGVIAAETPCGVVSGSSADPYPECCQKVVCNSSMHGRMGTSLTSGVTNIPFPPIARVPLIQKHIYVHVPPPEPDTT